MEVLDAVGDIDATGMRGEDTTTGEIVDGVGITGEGIGTTGEGIGIMGEGGIEIKEWEIRGVFVRSKDEADALGKSLVKRFLRLGRGGVFTLEDLHFEICLVRIEPCARVLVEADTTYVRLIGKGVAVSGTC